MSDKMLSPRVQSPNLQSPTGQRTAQLSSTPPKKFDGDLLRVYMKKLLSSSFEGRVWDQDQSRAWIREIGERVKERMLEIQPSGFKYVVTTQINQNLGQGGRAALVCHWEDSDSCIQEVYKNDSLICICIAFVIRIP